MLQRFRFQLTIILFLMTLNAFSQHRNAREAKPIFTEVSNKAVVQSVYPEATRVEKINEFWFRIVDDKNKLYGYAMNSTPYSNNIPGYNGPTPVMIITDKNLIIKKVALLSHYETPGYIRRMNQMGFFNSWDEVKLQDAIKVVPDGWTGATLTAESVKKNVDYMVENGLKNRPDKKSASRR
jgi:Na+-translocating ferredoxin:NAD+ oxidoreductase RnfG subunit